MPINYLTAIHHKSAIPYLRFDPEFGYTDMVEGIYVFENMSAAASMPLFNDGYSSLIIMPSLAHNSTVRYQNEDLHMQALWLCGSIQEQALWNNAQPIKAMLVIRFLPHVLPAIFPNQVQKLKAQPILNFDQLIDASTYAEFTKAYYKKSSVLEQLAQIQALIRALYKPVARIPSLLAEKINLRMGNNTTIINARPLLSAADYQVNYKWWQRNFKKYLGMGPKRFGESQRFLHAYALMDANSQLNLVEIALETGYYDANHLIKEFKKFVGRSPKFFFNHQARYLTSDEVR